MFVLNLIVASFDSGSEDLWKENTGEEGKGKEKANNLEVG